MKHLDLSDLQEQSEYLRLLVYGEPGTGKTWLGASAALHEATSPVLYLDYRGQVASIAANPQYVAAIEAKRLVILSLSDYAELNLLYTWLARGCTQQEPIEDLFDGIAPKTVVLDSITELQRLEILRRGGNSPNSFIAEVGRPQIQDWLKLLDQFVLLARIMFDLPFHVVFTALEHVQLDEKDLVQAHRIAMQGQARHQLPAYALTVMRLVKAAPNLKHFNEGLLSSRRSRVKDQTGALPSKAIGPTIPQMVALLHKDKGGEANEVDIPF